MMIPARHMPSSMIGRSSGGAAYGSSSALSLGQPNLLDSDNQHLQQALQQHHLLDQQIPAPAITAESGDHHHHGMIRGRESVDPLGDEFESRSGSENVDGDAVDADQDPNQRPRKKRYHRHTQHQIQEMEA